MWFLCDRISSNQWGYGVRIEDVETFRTFLEENDLWNLRDYECYRWDDYENSL